MLLSPKPACGGFDFDRRYFDIKHLAPEGAWVY